MRAARRRGGPECRRRPTMPRRIAVSREKPCGNNVGSDRQKARTVGARAFDARTRYLDSGVPWVAESTVAPAEPADVPALLPAEAPPLTEPPACPAGFFFFAFAAASTST